MERDRFLDLVRGSSILLVVLGHWTVSQFGWDGEELTLTSSLGAAPGLWPLTWLLQVIPLFFFVGGFANRHAWEGVRRRGEGYAAYVDHRVRRVLVPTVVLLVVLSAVSVVGVLVGGLGFGAGGGIVLQPLWFLGVYVVVIALTPVTLWCHQRWGGWVVVVLLAGVGLVDVVRLGFGVEPVAFANVFLVWIAAHQFGYLYGDGALTRPRAVALAVGGFVVLCALVGFGPYPARMVGVPGDQLANMNPPTAAIAALAVAQIGITVLLRPVVAPTLERPRLFAVVIAVNLSIMTIYLWHQAALVLVARVGLPRGLPQPDPPTWQWWLTRPLWFGLAGAVLALLAVVLRPAERLRPVPPAPTGVGTAVAAGVAVGLLFAGILALAACDVMRLLDTHQALGFLRVASVMGLVCVGVAGWLLRAARQGPRAVVGAAVGGAGLLALVALAYAAGAGPTPQDSGAASLVAVLAALPLLAGVAALLSGRATEALR